MKNKIYSLHSGVIISDGREYRTYGISGKNVTVEDISENRTFVENMIDKINDCGLEEIHLLDFISDSIC